MVRLSYRIGLKSVFPKMLGILSTRGEIDTCALESVTLEAYVACARVGLPVERREIIVRVGTGRVGVAIVQVPCALVYVIFDK